MAGAHDRGVRGAKARRETVDAAWQRWQASRVNSTSTLTHKTDASALRALPAPLRARRVSEISASDFEALYDMLLASLTRSSVVRYRNTYSAFFSWCQREQLIDRNPASAVRVPAGRASLLDVSQNRVSRLEHDDLERTQVDTLRRYVEAVGGRLHLEVEIGDQRIRIA